MWAEPPARPGRIVLVDVPRGFALFGVYGANLMIFSGLEYLPDSGRAVFSSGADRAVRFLEGFLVETKFMGLFSLLFGVSFWLFLARVRGRGVPPARLFYRRIGWLFVFGAVHGWLLWAFDILRFYALWGTFLPLLVRMRLRPLLALALGLSVLAPAMVAGIRATLPSTVDPGTLDAATLAAFAHGTYLETLVANWRYDWSLTRVPVPDRARGLAVLRLPGRAGPHGPGRPGLARGPVARGVRAADRVRGRLDAAVPVRAHGVAVLSRWWITRRSRTPGPGTSPAP